MSTPPVYAQNAGAEAVAERAAAKVLTGGLGTRPSPAKTAEKIAEEVVTELKVEGFVVARPDALIAKVAAGVLTPAFLGLEVAGADDDGAPLYRIPAK